MLPTDVFERFRTAYAARRVCITGGAGFIGGHLAQTLLHLGAEVSIIDDLSNSNGELVSTLVDRFPQHCHFVHGSILDPDALAEAVARCGVVFHHAAMVSVPRSVEDPERCTLVNMLGTERVAETARAAGVTRLVYAASSSAYGDTVELPKHEQMMPTPKSPYAAAKLTGEHIVRAWSQSYGLDGVSLRYFNIFGERQPAGSPYSAVIAAFADAIKRNEAPTIYGDGGQTRDFTHVANAVLANLLAGASDKQLGGAVVNIGCGQACSLKDLFAKLCAIAGNTSLLPLHEAERAGDVRDSLASIEAAKELLGYEPIVSLDEGLKRVMADDSGDTSQDTGVIGRIA